MVDAVRKCGGHVKFTVFPDCGMDMDVTYNDGRLYEWLLAQRRSRNIEPRQVLQTEKENDKKVISSLVIACHCWPPLPEDYVGQFKACEYNYTGGHYTNQLFRYRFLVPRSLRPEEHYPLLVWLHGAGSRRRKIIGCQLVDLDRQADDPDRVDGTINSLFWPSSVRRDLRQLVQ